MSTDKPSRNEDEYFAKKDMEILAQQRAAARAADEEATRAQYYMRCPKCGAPLSTQELRGVQVDGCPVCHGLWLDAGEIDQLGEREDRGMIGQVLRDLVSTFRGT